MERLFDLSTLDFQRLAELFAGGAKKTATEILRGQTEERAQALARRNPARIDLLERLNDLIERYNAGSMDVERLFEELTAFTRTLDEEEKRHLKEGLDEDELAVFDILTRPDPKLTKAEELEVKKIARELLAKLKREKFILDWRLKENAKADVRETIRQEFDLLPPAYDERMWADEAERTCQFVFERRGGAADVGYRPVARRNVWWRALAAERQPPPRPPNASAIPIPCRRRLLERERLLGSSVVSRPDFGSTKRHSHEDRADCPPGRKCAASPIRGHRARRLLFD